jgi:hypothetical protein
LARPLAAIHRLVPSTARSAAPSPTANVATTKNGWIIEQQVEPGETLVGVLRGEVDPVVGLGRQLGMKAMLTLRLV